MEVKAAFVCKIRLRSEEGTLYEGDFNLGEVKLQDTITLRPAEVSRVSVTPPTANGTWNKIVAAMSSRCLTGAEVMKRAGITYVEYNRALMERDIINAIELRRYLHSEGKLPWYEKDIQQFIALMRAGYTTHGARICMDVSYPYGKDLHGQACGSGQLDLNVINPARKGRRMEERKIMLQVIERLVLQGKNRVEVCAALSINLSILNYRVKQATGLNWNSWINQLLREGKLKTPRSAT